MSEEYDWRIGEYRDVLMVHLSLKQAIILDHEGKMVSCPFKTVALIPTLVNNGHSQPG